METITLKANGKINLTLDCLGKRSDGFHELEMIMSEIPLYDLVSVCKANEISVETNLKFLPSNNKNIAYKVAEAFFCYTNIKGGAKIKIEKNIPVSAGLAGGSTDGASVLKALNILYKTELTDEELLTIGNTVGKDIPFCLRGGVCLALGTGEKLTYIGKLPKCMIVLVKPDNISVSTADIFEKLDSEKTELHPHTKGAIECIKSGDINGLSKRLYNVMEPVTARMHPKILGIKSSLIDFGALGAVMSGTGPSVFGIFSSYEKANEAYRYFKKIYTQSYLLDFGINS